MEIPFVNLHRQHQPILEDLQNSIATLIATNRVIGGYFVEEFEDAFAKYLGIRHVVSCANGTDAIEIVLRAWDVGPGDEVIVPANGWVSLALVVRMIGATPVFVDTPQNSYNLDIEQLAGKITAHTKAILPIHLYGSPVDMAGLMKIAEHHSIPVLEDCAQAHGAQLLRKKVGGWGQAGIFSFYPTKNLGALGDGGAIVTNNRHLAERCRAIANYGQLKKNESAVLGRNSRLDSWQAKVLSTKLPYLDRWNERRKQIAACYRSNWQHLPVQLPEYDENSVWHLFVVQLDQRDQVKGELAQRGINSEIHYPIPVCRQPVFNNLSTSFHFPHAELHASRLLSIPLYPELTDAEVEYIVKTVKTVIEYVAKTHQ